MDLRHEKRQVKESKRKEENGQKFRDYYHRELKMKKIIEKFNRRMSESKNTLGADINEIMFAFIAAGYDWSNVGNAQEAQAALEARKSQITPEEYTEQADRAKAMHEEILSWAKENDWDGRITKTWWTARPGVLSSAVGKSASPGNPTDVLLQFESGDFLGISAKSTKSKADIGFKNPGVRPIGDALGIDLNSLIRERVSEFIQQYGLESAAKQRKMFLRDPANHLIKQKADEIGRDILAMLRESLYAHMQEMEEEDIRKHIVDYWMDAGSNYPYYIKVTGRGSAKKGYTASIDDPIKNEKYKALMSEPIQVVSVGSDSIGIKAGEKRIMKMRFKYESQKMASSLKMSGDPWG